jgi:transcriptional regulator with XRE-family HTH domain
LSQRAFAASIGVTAVGYMNYERGRREVPTAVLRSLYKVYDIDPIWVMDGPGDEPSMAALREPNLELFENLTRRIDEELARSGRALNPSERGCVIKSAYMLSAAQGHLNVATLKALVSVSPR